MRFILVTAFAVLAPMYTANAEESRQLDPHEHGHGALNIAIEGDRVSLELEVPGDDLVGFEHEPKNDADAAAIAKATSLLSDPLALFGVPAAAGCHVTEHSVEHGKEEHGEEEHDHDAAESVEEGEHSEFHATYVLQCTAPTVMTKLDLAYFSRFPGAQSLTVSIVTDKGQTKIEATRDEIGVDLGPVM
jgi:hypothetical protein